MQSANQAARHTANRAEDIRLGAVFEYNHLPPDSPFKQAGEAIWTLIQKSIQEGEHSAVFSVTALRKMMPDQDHYDKMLTLLKRMGYTLRPLPWVKGEEETMLIGW